MKQIHFDALVSAAQSGEIDLWSLKEDVGPILVSLILEVHRLSEEIDYLREEIRDDG